MPEAARWRLRPAAAAAAALPRDLAGELMQGPRRGEEGRGGGGGGGAGAAAARGEEEWRRQASGTTSAPARHAARSTLACPRPPPPHPAHCLPRQAWPRGVEMKTAGSEQRRGCLREARRKLQK